MPRGQRLLQSTLSNGSLILNTLACCIACGAFNSSLFNPSVPSSPLSEKERKKERKKRDAKQAFDCDWYQGRTHNIAFLNGRDFFCHHSSSDKIVSIAHNTRSHSFTFSLYISGFLHHLCHNNFRPPIWPVWLMMTMMTTVVVSVIQS